MIYLLLAILSSAMIAILMRISSHRISANLSMLAVMGRQIRVYQVLIGFRYHPFVFLFPKVRFFHNRGTYGRLIVSLL